MILELELKNFYSFKNKVSFSMETSSDLTKRNNYCYFNDDISLLKVSGIFGPNASGKTNLIYSLYTLSGILKGKSGSDSFDLLRLPFLLDKTSKNNNSSIRVDFIWDNNHYSYYVEMRKDCFSKESLHKVKENKKELLFKRQDSQDEEGFVGVELGKLVSDVQNGLRVHNDCLIFPLFCTIFSEEISKALNFFKSLQFENGVFNNLYKTHSDLEVWLSEDDNRKDMTLFLKYLGINTEGILQRKRNVKEDYPFVLSHSIYQNGKVADFRTFPPYMESSGTLSLVYMGKKLLSVLKNGGVLFVDEFGAMFHSEVSKFIIELFQDPIINKKSAQLIFTSHDQNLLSESFMRRDQVWFTEKNVEGITDLYSLVDFEGVSNNDDFGSWYRAHKFGAMPTLTMSNLRFSFNETGE